MAPERLFDMKKSKETYELVLLHKQEMVRPWMAADPATVRSNYKYQQKPTLTGVYEH